MCMNFVISNTTHTNWTWRIVNEKGETIAMSSQTFETRYHCIDDAENFQQTIPNAGFTTLPESRLMKCIFQTGAPTKGKPIKIAKAK